jgi:hypothetical protein
VTAVVAAAIALGACGVVEDIRYPYAKESGETIFLDSVASTSALKSVRLSGFLDLRSGPRIDFNILDARKGRCGGAMSFDTAEFDIVYSPEAGYLKGSAASWQQLPGRPAQAALLADRWVKVSGDEGLDPRRLCRFVETLLNEEEKILVGAGTMPDGVQVTHLGLSDETGEKAVELQVDEEDLSANIWVALDEPHYLLKFVGADDKARMEIVFSDFEFKGAVRLPRARDVLDPGEVSARSD